MYRRYVKMMPAMPACVRERQRAIGDMVAVFATIDPSGYGRHGRSGLPTICVWVPRSISGYHVRPRVVMSVANYATRRDEVREFVEAWTSGDDERDWLMGVVDDVVAATLNGVRGMSTGRASGDAGLRTIVFERGASPQRETMAAPSAGCKTTFEFRLGPLKISFENNETY